MTTTTPAAGTRTPLIPPSTHRYADVIHRLEAGGSMLPDTPENLQQILEKQLARQSVPATAGGGSAERMPFEPKGRK